MKQAHIYRTVGLVALLLIITTFVLLPINLKAGAVLGLVTSVFLMLCAFLETMRVRKMATR